MFTQDFYALEARLESPQISQSRYFFSSVCYFGGLADILAAVPPSHPVSVTVLACLNPAFFQAEQ